jgi:manganese/zinc/iron transport system substrate-binding protein
MLLEADIIFHNGLHLEGKMIDLINHLKDEKTVIAVTQLIDRAALIESPIPGIYDPHVWSDPLLFIHCIDCIYKTVYATLSERADKDELERRYNSYIEHLLATHRSIEQQISMIEQKQRVLVTAHDAFEYFARRYQFSVYALQGVSTEVDIGLADVNALIDFIIAHQVRAIFVESCIPYRSMETIQERTKARGWNVNIGGELYSDSLGDALSHASTYIKMLQYNTKIIVTALTAPQLQKDTL